MRAITNINLVRIYLIHTRPKLIAGTEGKSTDCIRPQAANRCIRIYPPELFWIRADRIKLILSTICKLKTGFKQIPIQRIVDFWWSLRYTKSKEPGRIRAFATHWRGSNGSKRFCPSHLPFIPRAFCICVRTIFIIIHNKSSTAAPTGYSTIFTEYSVDFKSFIKRVCWFTFIRVAVLAPYLIRLLIIYEIDAETRVDVFLNALRDLLLSCPKMVCKLRAECHNWISDSLSRPGPITMYRAKCGQIFVQHLPFANIVRISIPAYCVRIKQRTTN